MNQQLFKDTLSSPMTRTYCILDGAAVPDLPKRLYQLDPPNHSLIRGELTPDMVHVAPYVAIMMPNEKFTAWVIENSFGKNWGIYVQSRFSIFEMRRHFRSLISVHDEEGMPMIFRFYDPRVIRKFLPTCDKDQLKVFFGNVDTYFVEAEEEDKLLAYRYRNGELETREIDLTDKEE